MAAVINGWIDATVWMTRDQPPETIERFIREAYDAREIWVVGQPVVGYLSLDPVSLRIGGLYCSMTGQGIGKALLDQAKAGRDFIWLHTHVPNKGAQRFYRREGFVPTEVIAPQSAEAVPELRMEWHRA